MAGIVLQKAALIPSSLVFPHMEFVQLAHLLRISCEMCGFLWHMSDIVYIGGYFTNCIHIYHTQQSFDHK